VWEDLNDDGIQDPNDPGIANVTVKLFDVTTGETVGQTTTDAEGDYLFNNSNVNMNGATGLVATNLYQVLIDTTQASLAGDTLTTPDVGSDDQINSKFTLNGTTAESGIITPTGLGFVDHNEDAGFLLPAPDVTVAKTADLSPVTAGSTAGFTITITNIGTGTATGVTLSDPLPAGAGNDINWSINGGANGADFTITGAVGSQTMSLLPADDTLAAGASLVVHIGGTTTFADAPAPTFSGTLVNTATVNATNEAPALQNQKASSSITVQAPDVTVAKTADNSPIAAGSAAGFTITLTNVGAATATGVTLSDPLPAGAGNDIDWAINGGANAADFTISGAVGAQTLSLLPADNTLAAATSLVVHIGGTTTFADAPAPSFTGTLVNTATVNASNEAPALQNQKALSSITVQAPDVTVAKTADSSPITAGSAAGFTITLTNVGAATATGVTLSDPLPAGAGSDIDWAINGGANAADYTISGAVGGQTLSLLPADNTLAAGASLVVHIGGTTTFADAPLPTLSGTLVNTATISASNEAPALQNQRTSASITVQAPDVTVAKTADSSPIAAGSTAGFTITLTNVGTATATGVTLSDPLPAGAGSDIDWANNGGANAADFTISGAVGAQTLSLLPADNTLAAGASLVVHIGGTTTFADAPAPTFSGTLVNTATVNAGNEAPALQNQRTSASITVEAPDVTVAKTADSSPITAGSAAGFTITLTNIGAATATGVTLSDPLPAGAGSEIDWAINGGANGADFTISGAVGSQTLSLLPADNTLAAGASLVVHIGGTTTFADAPAPTFTGTLVNTATVNATNEAPALQNQKASSSITVQASEVTVAKTADSSPIAAGSAAGFTITLTNVGTATATGVTLSDPLPAGAGNDIDWAINGGANGADFTIKGAVGAQTLSLLPADDTLAAGASLVVHISGTTTSADAPAPTFSGTLVNTATASATNEAPALQNQRNSASITVEAPDVTVAKTADQSPITAGSAAGFTITVTNIGSATATGVTLSDPLPAGAGNNINWAINGGANGADFRISGAVGSQTLSLLPADNTMAAGASLVVHIGGTTTVADAPAPSFSGTLVNTATVSASNEAPALQNQKASASITVQAPPDVTITQTPDNGTVTAGSPAGYTITLTNIGTATANGVTFGDLLPAGTGGDVNWSITGGANAADFTISGPVGSQTLTLLPAGNSLGARGTLVVHINGPTTFADAPAPTFSGPLVNTGTVSAANEAVALQNQKASANITVQAPDVTVTKTADQSAISAGGAAGFTITLTNVGTATATGVALSDPLPAGAGRDINWLINGGANAADFTISGPVGGQTLGLLTAADNLAAGASLVVHIGGTTTFADAPAPSYGGTLVNTATVNAVNEAPALHNQQASASITVSRMPPVAVGGVIWKDLNGVGLDQAGDPGIAGVTVQLYTTSGQLAATVVTDATGHYLFSSDPTQISTSSEAFGLTALTPNTVFIVRLDNPANMVGNGPLAGMDLTKALVGANPNVNSKGAITNSVVTAEAITGGPGSQNLIIDFGFISYLSDPSLLSKRSFIN
jgi:uncharacterized repeat protein (TIGR01451 family)